MLAADSVEAGAPGVGVAPQDRRPSAPVNLRLIAAIAAVWILWGSTFAGMHVAVQTIPPFVMASLRFTVAGAILYLFCVLGGRGRVTRGDLVRALVTGSTLLLLGNGMTAWTVQFLPTGFNSLLLSLSPMWMALIAFAWGGERPARIALVGMFLGLAGLALLLLGPGVKGGYPAGPTAVAVLVGIAWAFGSVYQRRTGNVANVVLATALQMLCGGLLIGAEAALLGEWRTFDPHAVSTASIEGLAWLIVFGSVLAYCAYLYTMHTASASLASTYAYVNPVVAVLIGVVAFHERFTPVEAVASAIILCGVALMLRPPGRTAAAAR
jgi:drug/metabolite transporter (DMT)-like permease